MTENELYKKLYYTLFNSITDALESDNKEEIKELLKNAQIKTEEMFISFEE